MGSLGGLVASRIARELHIGGPSFSVSCDETSGTQALQIAAKWLHRGELDAAVVGAVDLCGDVRAVLASGQVAGAFTPGEGAAGAGARAWTMRFRDGDRVYAVLRGAAAATARSIGEDELPDLKGVVDPGPVDRAIGKVGAAAGLARVVAAAISLYQEILPPSAGDSPDRPGPQFWLRNRAEGPSGPPSLWKVWDAPCTGWFSKHLSRPSILDRSGRSSRSHPWETHGQAIFALEANAQERASPIVPGNCWNWPKNTGRADRAAGAALVEPAQDRYRPHWAAQIVPVTSPP